MDQGVEWSDAEVNWLPSVRSALTRSGILLWGLPLALLIGFFFFPMASILGVMFERSGSIMLRDVWQPLGFTVYQALFSTLLTLLFGLPAPRTSSPASISLAKG